MRAERVGADTLLAQIVQMVADAAYARPDTETGRCRCGLVRADRRADLDHRCRRLDRIGPEPRYAHALVVAVSV